MNGDKIKQSCLEKKEQQHKIMLQNMEEKLNPQKMLNENNKDMK